MIKKIDLDSKIVGILENIVNETVLQRNIISPNITKEQFFNFKIPNYNQTKGVFEKKDGIDILSKTHVRYRDSKRYIDMVKGITSILNYDRCTNAKISPAMSVLNWHTNSDFPGTRIYYTYTEKEAIFRYRDPATGEIIDDYDNFGWTVRQFEIPKDSLFWHAVWSEGTRYTFGFIKSNA